MAGKCRRPRARATPRTRLYSCGKTLMNRGCASAQCSRTHAARGLPVRSRWRSSRPRTRSTSASVDQRLQIDAGLVAAARGEVAPIVVDVGDAAAHAGGEVAAGGAEDDDEAVGHVLAAVIADAFNDRGGAGVADGEALAGDAVEEDFAAGGAVEDHVADQDAFLRQEARGLGRIGDDAAAGKALAEVVVGVAFKFERDAVGNECAKALAGRAVELEVDGAVGQAGRAVAARDFAAQHGAHGAVHVADGEAAGDRRL